VKTVGISEDEDERSILPETGNEEEDGEHF
jgi:hypothetical protein